MYTADIHCTSCAIRFISVVQVTLAIQFELAGDRFYHQRGQDVYDNGHRHLGYHGQGEEVRRWVGPMAALTTQVDAADVGDDYNDVHDDDDDEYIMCTYNLVVHPPALAICVHLLSPAGFPAGPMSRLQYKDRHRPNACGSPGKNRIHGMCITAEFVSALLCVCLTLVPEVVYHSGVRLRSDLCVCRSICGRGGVSQRSSSPL